MRQGRDRSAGRLRAAPPARLLAAALALGPAAAAASASAGGPVAPRAAPVWTVDKAASRISFRAAAGRPFDGVFKHWDAQLAFDPANLPASRLSVTVEAASAMTGEPARDALLPGAAWLAAGRYPTAAFVSRSFAAAGPDRYLVSGELTVRGVARPLAVPVTVRAGRDRTELSGGFALDRTAFGVGPAGADAAVQVSVRLAARRAK